MSLGRSIATALILVSGASFTATADEETRARAKAAVARSDVQSKLEHDDLSESDPFARFGGTAVPIAAPAVTGLGTILLYTGIVVAAILLLLTAYRLLFNRPAPTSSAADQLRAAAGLSADDATADEWFGDADQLAREGRWTEAVHALLLAAIRRLSDEFGRPKPSRTSRELLRQFRLDDARRDAFRGLIVTVEAAVFGGRRPDAENYQACRECLAVIRGTPA
jgi:hypothetical protein